MDTVFILLGFFMSLIGAIITIIGFIKKKSITKRITILIVGVILLTLGVKLSPDETNQQIESEKVNSIQIEKIQDSDDLKTKTKKEIKNSIISRVKDQYEETDILSIDVNENLGTEENKDDYIVLVSLKWNRMNKIERTKKTIEMHGDDLAATLSSRKEIEEVIVFWEVPYMKEGSNFSKMTYVRNGKNMQIERKDYF